jgi:hypothetical protein
LRDTGVALITGAETRTTATRRALELHSGQRATFAGTISPAGTRVNALARPPNGSFRPFSVNALQGCCGVTVPLRFLVLGTQQVFRSDLDEAWEIAERGPMPLFLADIHLHRARLFHADNP